MIVLVTGSRHSCPAETTWPALDRMKSMIGCIVTGGADGIDSDAREWARHNGIPYAEFEANWDYYNRAAGPIRNGWMLRFMSVDLVLAFPGGTGTRNMVEQATKKGVKVKHVKV